MEAASATSKVTVTYWDPAALFPLISPDLHSRLPLRNLHWKSPSRPLRSINSLHVDLIPYTPPAPSVPPAEPPPSSSNNDLTRVRSTDSTRSAGGAHVRTASRPRGNTTGNRPRKERRHQIPGLRNTPYLKVYILRCDDNDSYKNTQRKLLREWISTHATSADSDNHDAFEWLILHVVLPGTPAALQPRSSSGASPSGGPRWMKAGSTTLLDKIRSDFNGSSSKVDRVVQIRIPPSHPDLSTLSPPVSVANQKDIPVETPQESEMAWVDLVSKLKQQILASFDARVGQYEDDIRERDSQRQLPGWNFCTFFVLKEGLARAFESVGLVEDALVLYDELGFGLEAIVQEQEKGGEITGGSFHSWTKECLWWIEEARKRLNQREGGKDEEAEVDDGNPVDAEKKPYRELILSNEISVLDFRCYLFARQTILLVRLGRRGKTSGVMAPTGGSSLQEAAAAVTGGPPEQDDLHRLAEVCKRGIDFITHVARVLRADLWTGYSGNTDESGKTAASGDGVIAGIIDNLVASWTFGVAQQLLTQTTSPALPEGLNDSSGRSMLPKRTSSLMKNTHDATRFDRTAKSQGAGMEELAAGRADLMLLARGVVEGVGKQRGWIDQQGWFHITASKDADMEEIDLNDDGDGAGKKRKGEWISVGIRNKALKDAVLGPDKMAFYTLFGDLSEKAMRHYGMARRYKSAERVEADLAALKFHLKDYEKAASHLQRMTNFYSEQRWGLIETTLLSMYAKCLKEMQQPEEYIRVILRLLYKSASAEKSRVRKRAGKSADDDGITNGMGAGVDVDVDVRGYVNEALTLSEDLQDEIETPMTHLWCDITVDPYPQTFPDKDGFHVAVKMRYLLDEEMEVDRIAVRVVNTISQGKDLWLESGPGITMKKGVVREAVVTNTTIPGTYVVDRIVVSAKRLNFIHEFLAKTTPPTPIGVSSNSAAAIADAKKMRLSFFPAPRNLLVRLAMPKRIHLDQMRMVEIILEVGDNELLRGELRIRSATAGLRLMTGSIEVADGASIQVDPDAPNIVALGSMAKASVARLRVPYTSENELTDLSIRLEVDYTTASGDYSYAEQLSIQVALPLAVNVQDVFKKTALFSKFQVSTAAAEVPLRIVKAILMSSKSFDATCGQEPLDSMVVYAKQPASLVYKISKKASGTAESAQDPLALVIDYTSIDEEIRQAILTVFSRELREAGLGVHTHRLHPVILTLLRQRPPSTLETTALLDEVDLGAYTDYPWDDSLDTVTPAASERARVETFLKTFFAAHPAIPLFQPDAADIVRTIVIPVEVPQLQVIHTVELRLLCDTQGRSLNAAYAPPMVTVGQALPAELTIVHSRHWDSAPSSTSSSSSSASSNVSIAAPSPPLDEPLEFFYELQNNVDVWLVSGRKRAHFTATHGSTHRFPVLLVPVRSGHLLLPNVEIKQALAPGAVEVSLETDYTANATTLLVLPDVRSTTVRIDSVYGEGVMGRA